MGHRKKLTTRSFIRFLKLRRMLRSTKSRRHLERRRSQSILIVVEIKKSFRRFSKLMRFLRTKKNVIYTINMEKMVLKKEAVGPEEWMTYLVDYSEWEGEDNSRLDPRRANL